MPLIRNRRTVVETVIETVIQTVVESTPKLVVLKYYKPSKLVVLKY
jgi:hypothetical protein